jgi:UDP-GlcNAc:undecaprenyl-phosphate GlcNAc-1-phosphate transferase
LADYLPILSSLALALGLVPAARALARRFGLVDHPGSELKIHSEPTPVLGGVAVLASTLGGLVLTGHGVPLTAAAAAAFGCAVGLVDDHRPLPARGHLFLQVSSGVMLAVAGVRVDAFGPFSPAVVIALAVCCMNAVNLIDGQDGLAGGLAAIAALGLAMLATGGSSTHALGFAVAGSLLAFLLWNRPPARIFLGNGGAYAIGLILAVLVAGACNAGGWAAMPSAGLCLAVFGFELIFTVVRRTSGSLSSGDRLHSYDILAARIGSRGSATSAFYVSGAAAALLAVTVDRAPAAAAATTICVAVAAVCSGRLARARLARRRPSALSGLPPRARPVSTGGSATRD